MLLLVQGATVNCEQFKDDEFFGILTSPGERSSMQRARKWRKVLALDNGCFRCLDAPAYLRMLAKGCAEKPVWVTAPDKLVDARETLRLFGVWEPVLHEMGFPVAFVAQNGIERIEVPWDRLECLFVGGDDGFKISRPTAELCLEAKRRGKWVHIGRVNSRIRMLAARAMGADSVDGSGFNQWPSKRLPQGLRWIHEVDGMLAEMNRADGADRASSGARHWRRRENLQGERDLL